MSFEGLFGNRENYIECVIPFMNEWCAQQILLGTMSFCQTLIPVVGFVSGMLMGYIGNRESSTRCLESFFE